MTPAGAVWMIENHDKMPPTDPVAKGSAARSPNRKLTCGNRLRAESMK